MIAVHCGSEPPPEGKGITSLPKIASISFGTGWNTSDSAVTDTGRTFPSTTDTIFYQVKFDSTLRNWVMIKKEWRRNDTILFSAISLIPIGSKRICGELRHYDSQALEKGIYKISIFYFNADSNAYIEAQYNTDVNRTFNIQ
jgi:hypothetical protein